jgi:RNA polymerase sigma-70 factor (ECF subfamily)
MDKPGWEASRLGESLADAGVSDAALLERVRRRDEAALAALYDRYAGMVLAVALRVVGNRQVAEEIMQDAFLRCWNGVETYHPERGPVAAWLLGITRNRSIDVLRSRQHRATLHERTELGDLERMDVPGREDEAEVVAIQQTVAAALNGLSMPQRQAIELAYYGGMTQKEIAHRTGEPVGTIKSRTRIALDHLRKSLRPHFDTTGADGDR